MKINLQRNKRSLSINKKPRFVIWVDDTLKAQKYASTKLNPTH